LIDHTSLASKKSKRRLKREAFWRRSMPVAATKAKPPAAWASPAKHYGKNWISMKVVADISKHN